MTTTTESTINRPTVAASNSRRIVAIPELVFTVIAVFAATGSGAVLFSESSKGTRSFDDLLWSPGLPSFGLLVGVLVAAQFFHWRRLRAGILFGAAAGIAGTVGLEVVRQIGFRVFESMPGDLPRLMGIKATGRIMQGPNNWSDFVGYADHFWNGAAFGITFALILGGWPSGRRWAMIGTGLATLYGLCLGFGFAHGPVPKTLGIGGPFATVTVTEFRTTVYLAHIAFGLVMGLVLVASNSRMRPIWSHLQLGRVRDDQTLSG